ncbi:MAG: acyltransferase family protein [Marinicella sp.]|nr:acyltransferase [Xanthomonadales bacterium]
MSIKYRKDIDGLRAIAVMPVVLFHSGVPFFSGGYVGVDIFFVISGYLITGILLKDLSTQQFSIVEFYHRRVKRIFPALFTVLIVTTLLSMWLMFPGEFKKYQSSLLSTLLFYSNYFFMFDIGYFDGPAESKPLLHMWSLAVEEQFYVLFPIYLYLVNKYFKQHVLKITVFIFALSLFYSIYMVSHKPSDAFYSTPARSWELLVGSILAILTMQGKFFKPWIAKICSFLGLLSILFSVFWFSNITSFPGSMALFPVLGSAAIILAGSSAQPNLVKMLLSSPPMVFIGLISYSLYLWHWPLLVFFRKYSFGQETAWEMALLIGLMVVIAYLSWRFIENPFRRGRLYSNTYKFRINIKTVVLILAISCIVYFSSINFKRQLTEEVRRILLASGADNSPIKLDNCDRFFSENEDSVRVCALGDITKDEISFAVLGDSHGDMLKAGIDKAARKYAKKGVYAGSGGCLALIGVHQVRQGFATCETRVNAFLEFLQSKPEIKNVILISRWAIYAEGMRYKNTLGSEVYIKDYLTENLSREENKRVFERSFERTVEQISQLGKHITIVGQVPESEWGARELALAKLVRPSLNLNILKADYEERQRFVSSVFNKYQAEFKFDVIYPHLMMCDDLFCEQFDEGISIYRDNNHIARFYAEKISTMYHSIFN